MFDGGTLAEVNELLPYLTEEERREINDILSRDTALWRPLPGPQYMAYISQADIVGFGGAAGGGKSDVMIGKALMKHTYSQIFRREYTQMKGIVQRMTEIMGGRDGYNGQDKTWRIPGTKKQIEFGSVPNLGDETGYQGRPKDFLGIDEAANFLRQQVDFLKGWVRTTIPGQECQTMLTFNPPTTAEGRWVIDYFAPWLDEGHPIPAAPGELRWFATIGEEDREVFDGRHFVIDKKTGDWLYDFDPKQYLSTDIIKPQTRTFIPSKISDNPFLVNTGYIATLQAMPEPLRSQMLSGDFKAGMSDDPWQVIPTAWVEAAQARWKERDEKPPMDSMGVDVARGGKDKTIIARRHGWWFDKAVELEGIDTNSGPKVAAAVIQHLRNRCPIHLDIIGIGASPYDFLVEARQQVVGVNVSEAAGGRDRSGRLEFKNLRSQLWWKFREMLDPDNNYTVCLPPDRQLLVELCAPTWKVQGHTIQVESREDIVKRIGRSPDKATAYVLAAMDTPQHDPHRTTNHSEQRNNYDPFARANALAQQRRGYNPLNR